MRTGFYFLTFVSLIFICNSSAQIVGRLVDENGDGLYEVTVDAHLGNDMYSSTTDTDGNFTILTMVSVEDEILPEGYLVSDNYPNPFNPKTRINIALPQKSQVDVHIYNLLGQQVRETISEVFDAGINSLDLELNGLANGIYLARISIAQKYSVTKKLMLIYGSQHLSTLGGSDFSLGKSNSLIQSITEIQIDSLVAYNSIIGRKVFTQLPTYSGQTLDLGNFEFARYCVGVATVTYEGKVYNTVLIGNHCWLKENLDVGTMIQSTASGFQQTDNGTIEKYCYDNDPANCETYGGLYEWPEAMQYTTTQGTQGICPNDWHIPTLGELEELETIVDDNANALIAGTGLGINTSGFSALLAGWRVGNGSFHDLGSFTYFRSSTNAFAMRLLNHGSIFLYGYDKDYGYSVRCVKVLVTTNNPPNIPSNSFPPDNDVGVSTTARLIWRCSDPDGDPLTYDVYFGTSSNPPLYQSGISSTYVNPGSLNENTTYYWKIVAKDNNGGTTEGSVWSFETGNGGGSECGNPITYAGKTYNTVQIGNQCWLKENLNYAVNNSWCYAHNTSNCETYGRLYPWQVAMNGSTSPGAQGICPNGWHIPTLSDFEELKTTVNSDGNALKAIGQGSGSGAGTNTSGFSALLAGRGSSNSFQDLGRWTFFWSSTEFSNDFANSMTLYDNSSYIILTDFNKGNGFSVRCVKD